MGFVLYVPALLGLVFPSLVLWLRDLSSNNFTGSIPHSISTLTTLEGILLLFLCHNWVVPNSPPCPPALLPACLPACLLFPTPFLPSPPSTACQPSSLLVPQLGCPQLSSLPSCPPAHLPACYSRLHFFPHHPRRHVSLLLFLCHNWVVPNSPPCPPARLPACLPACLLFPTPFLPSPPSTACQPSSLLVPQLGCPQLSSLPSCPPARLPACYSRLHFFPHHPRRHVSLLLFLCHNWVVPNSPPCPPALLPACLPACLLFPTPFLPSPPSTACQPSSLLVPQLGCPQLSSLPSCPPARLPACLPAIPDSFLPSPPSTACQPSSLLVPQLGCPQLSSLPSCPPARLPACLPAIPDSISSLTTLDGMSAFFSSCATTGLSPTASLPPSLPASLPLPACLPAIPDSISTLTTLEGMWVSLLFFLLNNNQLTGTIPSAIFTTTNLKYLPHCSCIACAASDRTVSLTLLLSLPVSYNVSLSSQLYCLPPNRLPAIAIARQLL
ncbi:unnamed protein product [Closterium sp. NIES-64]|nr:unnamed protein product [Closterium sp. NIES-64]